MRLLILCFLFIFTENLHAQVIKEISTSKSEYEYGEIIEITYSISNFSDLYIPFKGTSTYFSYFVDFSGVSLIPTVTTLDDYRDTLWPGEMIELSWELDPKKLSLPKESGNQSVSVSLFGIVDTVTFNAPKYKGGIFGVYFNSQIIDTVQADSILASYDAIVHSNRFPSYRIEVKDYQIDSLSAAWLDKQFILEANFDFRNEIESISRLRTNNEHDLIPSRFELFQNYPNPFNPTTSIPFSIDKSGWVRLEVYNSKGASLAKIYEGWLAEGVHTFRFSGNKLASGVYFYRLQTESTVVVKAMTLLK